MKEDIISITLAELSMVLLFLIIIISFSDSISSQNNQNKKSYNKKDILVLQAKLERKELELIQIKKKLKSKQLPSCTAKGFAKGFLDTVTILSLDQYEISDHQYSYSELKQFYQKKVLSAREIGCVHSIKVRYEKSIALEHYLKALKRLEQWFYIKRIKEDRNE